MARRKDHIAPFEIMGMSKPPLNPDTHAAGSTNKTPANTSPHATGSTATNPASSTSSTSANTSTASTSSSNPTASTQAPQPNRNASNPADQPDAGPVVLRIPRGMMVVAAFGAIGLLMIAYLVGHSLGEDAGYAAAIEELGTDQVWESRPMPAVPFDSINDSPASTQNAATGEIGRVYTPADPDPRTPTLNYLILARYPEDEARQLAYFVSQYGLDIAVVSSDNARLFHVIVVRGFRPDELGDAGQRFRDQLRAIGREWKRENNNRGNALEDMYFSRYE